MKETQQKILLAARTVLINEGSSGFSVRKVAAEADVRLNGVQYYYKTKVDLIAALFDGYLEEYQAGMAELIANCGDGKAGLHTFIENCLTTEASPEELKLTVAFTALAEQEEVFSQRLNSLFDALYQSFITFLAHACGKSPDDELVIDGASLLLPYINGYGLVYNNIGRDAKRSASLLTDVIWQAVGGASSGE